jgi:nitroimidazol reductase NimA-like FMN-containing flavoprotein (pyridoxamine 5'-phosphate oxidase superfamily)
MGFGIMRKAPYITVSFTRPDGSAYGLPLSLAAKDDNTWYFHCALEGDKLDAIKTHPKCVFRPSPMPPHRRTEGWYVHLAV